MKKTIEDYDLNNKKVIIRCDLNVPIKGGVILDDNRIIESIKTIKYAVDNNAKVILLSHLGRIKTEEDKKNNTLRPVAKRLSEALGIDVKFISETRGQVLENVVNNMKEKMLYCLKIPVLKMFQVKKKVQMIVILENTGQVLGIYL